MCQLLVNVDPKTNVVELTIDELKYDRGQLPKIFIDCTYVYLSNDALGLVNFRWEKVMLEAKKRQTVTH